MIDKSEVKSERNISFATWHHYCPTTVRILQGFVFLCKLGLWLFTYTPIMLLEDLQYDGWTSYLQWTVIFTTALAGLLTPLLAVHWHWIMLSGVPGLVTFTILMDEPWGKTLESPTLVHVIIGGGFPEALQDNVTLLPSTAISIVLEISTDGATEERETMLKNNWWQLQYLCYIQYGEN